MLVLLLDLQRMCIHLECVLDHISKGIMLYHLLHMYLGSILMVQDERMYHQSMQVTLLMDHICILLV